MILHSIVSPEYIFPYEPTNSVMPVRNGYKVSTDNSVSLFSTDPVEYINGEYLCENQYLSTYIKPWRKF